MTVAAANTNQLTQYTSYGFSNGNPANNEDTIKLDIMAPGGSLYHGAIMSVDSNDGDASTYFLPEQRNNDYSLKRGTSMAAPFVAGAAALVIDAWQQNGKVWSFSSSADPLFVKMLLCATATESNQQREYDPATSGPGINNPTLGRASTPKDPAEGYGMMNVDAAIECLRRPPLIHIPITETLGSTRFDKRASGFNVKMTSGNLKTFQLTVPAGADYDLYLYSATPDARGNPVILASSTSSTLGGTETISYTPSVTSTYYLVAKRVSGSGAFTLKITTPPVFINMGLINASSEYSYGYAINNSGAAVGFGDTKDGEQHAVRYVTSLFDLGGEYCTCDNTYAYGINDSGMIVGYDDYFGTGTRFRGFKWTSSGGYVELNPLTGGNLSDAFAINNNGDIAGYARNNSSVDRPARWRAGLTNPDDVGSLVVGDQGSNPGYAYAVNSAGYIVGKARTSSGSYHAFRCGPSPAQLNAGTGDDLGTLSGNNSHSSMAYAINDARQIVGSSQNTSGNYRAFLKAPDSASNQGFTDLGVLSGTTSSSAYGINRSGMVVGTSGGQAAFIWQPGLGMQNLNTYLPAGVNWSLSSAEGINDDGAVVGYGTPSGSLYAHGFILKPSP